MLSLDRLKAYREWGYTSRDMEAFLGAQTQLGSDEFVTMTVDVADKNVVETFGIGAVMQNQPVEVIQDRKLSYSEAVYATPMDGIYFVVSMDGYAKDDETLLALFRSEWKKFPVESGLHEHRLVAMSPGLNKAYQELLVMARQ